MRAYRVRLSALSFALCAALAFGAPALAGTTGAIGGHVIDSATQQPLAGVKVSFTSPSQTEATTTDATGSYSFVSLAPDTYSVTASLTGYDPTTLAGVTVLVDQNQTLTIVLKKSAAVIGRVSVTGAGGLVRAGITSNVYSVSGAQGQAASALAGAGNLNSAYGQMASVPGVSAVQGQQGWYQPIYIRGGDLDQVGWEFTASPSTARTTTRHRRSYRISASKSSKSIPAARRRTPTHPASPVTSIRSSSAERTPGSRRSISASADPHSTTR